MSYMTKYYACCETMHMIWAGPDRDTQDEALSDAAEHDRKKHNSQPTAVALPTDVVVPSDAYSEGAEG